MQDSSILSRRLGRFRRNSEASVNSEPRMCGWAHRSSVYFIRPIGMDGPIKIGCTGDLASRLSDLCKSSPFALEVVISVAGAIRLEKRFHARHHASRLHGEWFSSSPELLEDIRRLEAGEDAESVLADTSSEAA